MNAKRLFKILVPCLILALLLSTGVALAGGSKTPFTGTECFVEVLDYGDVKIVGNTMIITGYRSHSYITATDPRMTGDSYVTLDLVIDLETGIAGLSGSYVLVNEGGKFVGKAGGTQNGNVESAHSTGRGRGAYEGLLVRAKLHRTDPSACLDIKGYITEAGK